MIGFLLTIAGGVAAWHYRKEIRDFVEREWPSVREKTAESRKVVEHRAEDLLNKVTELRRRYRDDASTRRTRPPESRHGNG